MPDRSVYLETTIFSYLAARRSRDLIVAAKQETTWEWWEQRRGQFELFVSQLVVDEAADGDPEAATRRLALLAGIPLLRATPDVTELAEALVHEGALPESAAKDAAHVAISAVHEIDCLLTWNCRHLANLNAMRAIAGVLAIHGYEPPTICTPYELLED